MLDKYCRLLFFPCKIGDFKIAGFVCLQKKVCLPSLLRPIFGDFFQLFIEKLDRRLHSVLMKEGLTA
jgi:hypothetical protein